MPQRPDKIPFDHKGRLEAAIANALTNIYERFGETVPVAYIAASSRLDDDGALVIAVSAHSHTNPFMKEVDRVQINERREVHRQRKEEAKKQKDKGKDKP